MENRKVRVRFAPSPTGPLHMGGVRTALYNYLFAKKHGGDFILRIEDTDQDRFVPGAEEYIIEALKWAGISPNEGIGFGDGPYAPYRQSDRKPMYRQYADQLIQSGHAYYAFDTKEELDEMRKRMEAAGGTHSYNAITRQGLKNSLTLPEDEVQRRLESGEPYVIRIKIPRNEEVRVKDLIRGWVVVQSSQMDDKVLFKSDGMPTYHLANIVDDYSMKITHVIRGEEWLPSAPLHVLLYRYLGWDDVMPEFAHLPLLLRPDGNGKLSKRDGDRLGFPVFPLSGNLLDVKTGKPESFSGYREAGYFAEAFINMLALLGWHSSGNQEIFSLEELVQEFSLDRVSKSGARFDPEKTKWFNQHYLRATPDEKLVVHLRPQVNAHLGETESARFSDAYLQAVAKLLKEKAHFVSEFWSLGSYFFTEPAQYDAEVIKKRWNADAKRFLAALQANFSQVAPAEYQPQHLEAIFKATATETGINPGHVMQLLRVAISGVGGGPALFEVVALLGKEQIHNRLEKALQWAL